MSRESHHSPNWGGARVNAGRQAKRESPQTDLRALNPEKFVSPQFYLLARMNDEAVPAVLRDQIATALLPYFCPQLRKGEHRSLAEIAASLNDEQLDMLLERYGVAGGGLDEFQSSRGNGKLQ